MPTTRQLNLTNCRLDAYRLVGRLGAGAQNEVWEAINTNDGAHRAVKVFVLPRDDRRKRTEAQRQLRKEVDAIKAEHNQPGLIKYYDTRSCQAYLLENDALVDASSGALQVFVEMLDVSLVVMELLDGGCVGPDYIEEVVKVDHSKFLQHLIWVAAALEYVHQQGLVHRDIKPENLLWSRARDVVKVGDFGLANAPSETLESLGICGTFPYLAPECFAHGYRNAPSRDVYALGVTMFELLTGRRPFPDPHHTSDDATGWERIHRNAIRPDAILACDRITPRLSDLIRDCIAANPDDRPTMQVIKEVLEEELALMNGHARTHRDSPIDHPRYLDDESVQIFPDHRIIPHVRVKFFSEEPYWVMLAMENEQPQRICDLQTKLHRSLGPTYSIFEVSGTWTFLLRLWLRPSDDLTPLWADIGSSVDKAEVLRCVKRVKRRDKDIEEVKVELVGQSRACEKLLKKQTLGQVKLLTYRGGGREVTMPLSRFRSRQRRQGATGTALRDDNILSFCYITIPDLKEKDMNAEVDHVEKVLQGTLAKDVFRSAEIYFGSSETAEGLKIDPGKSSNVLAAPCGFLVSAFVKNHLDQFLVSRTVRTETRARPCTMAATAWYSIWHENVRPHPGGALAAPRSSPSSSIRPLFRLSTTDERRMGDAGDTRP